MAPIHVGICCWPITAINVVYSWCRLSSRHRKSSCCEVEIRQNWAPTPGVSTDRRTVCCRKSCRVCVVQRSCCCSRPPALNTPLLLASTLFCKQLTRPHKLFLLQTVFCIWDDRLIYCVNKSSCQMSALLTTHQCLACLGLKFES